MNYYLFQEPYTFLTTKPRTRQLSRNHPEWLAVCVLEPDGLADCLLRALITYTDGSTANHILIDEGDIPALLEGSVYAFEIGFDRYAYDAVTPAKTIKHIRIHLENAAFEDQLAQDHVIYYPYTPAGDYVRALYYHNSYGGLDSVICTGDRQRSVAAQGYESSRAEDIRALEVPQKVYNHLGYEEQVKVTTGAKPSGEIDALHDLLTIKSAFEYKDLSGEAYLVPIIPNGDGFELPSEKTNVKMMSFSYRYAHTQKAIDRIGV